MLIRSKFELITDNSNALPYCFLNFPFFPEVPFPYTNLRTNTHGTTPAYGCTPVIRPVLRSFRYKATFVIRSVTVENYRVSQLLCY